MKKLYYFTISILISTLGRFPAQLQPLEEAPGGIRGTKVWFVTEEVEPGHNFSHWVDKSGHGLVLKQGENEEYRWEDKEHNFHKSLMFYRDDVYFDLPESNIRQFTTFGLFNPYQYSVEQPYEFLLYDVVNDTDRESFNMLTDKLYNSDGSPRIDYGLSEGSDLWFRSADNITDNTLRYRTTKILSHYKASSPDYGIWGEDEKTTRFYLNKSRAGKAKIWYFIPEFIVYDRLLSKSERLRVESYLARKYAISLENSYLNPGGDIMWDYVENKTYNHRIFYVGREDIGNLFQPDAVSSYEDYTYNNIEGAEGAGTGYNSTSDNRHWYNRDLNRLISFRLNLSGEFSDNEDYGGLSDGDYFMMGDDNGSLKVNTDDNEGMAGMRTIGRSWRVESNVVGRSPGSTAWRSDSFLTVNTDDTYPVLSLENTAAANLENRVFTTTALVGDKGSIEGALPTIFNEAGGSLLIGFSATDDPDAGVYYGFEIDPNGYIYRYEKGQRGALVDGYVGIRNRYVKVDFEGDKITFSYLYSGASPYFPYTASVTLDPGDKAKIQYGLVHYKGSGNGNILTHLKARGFVNQKTPTTRIELRGTNNQVNVIGFNGMTGMPDVDPNDNKRVYLLIDPSGKGNFSGTNIKKIPANEWVLYGGGRYLFDDLVWDEDGNGGDAFTFGYREGSILARIEHKNMGCNEEGNIKVTLTEGNAVSHSLRVYDASNQLVYEGSITVDEEKTIPISQSGVYKVSIKNPENNEEATENVSVGDACADSRKSETIETKDQFATQVEVYPNPARVNTPFTIAVKNAQSKGALVLVTDLSGKLIWQKEVLSMESLKEIPCSIATEGVYLIKVIMDNGEYNKKVIIR